MDILPAFVLIKMTLLGHINQPVIMKVFTYVPVSSDISSTIQASILLFQISNTRGKSSLHLRVIWNLALHLSQPSFTRSKSAMKTSKQYVKS